jgi:ATP-dependent protease ClpP protease subunit
MKKILYLTGEINPENISNMAQGILRTQLEKDITEIELYIYSGGGFFYPAFALYDIISNSEIPVHTIANGYCASSAVIILQAGVTRKATKNTVFMLHQSSFTIESSQKEEFMVQSKQFEIERTMFATLTSSKSNLTPEYFENLTTSDYFTAEKALNLGLVDSIT